MFERQQQNRARPTRYPNNIKITANEGKTLKELPEIWNQLQEEQKSLCSIKNLLENIKFDCFDEYQDFKCTTENCEYC